jgi:anti-anti-sigma factor
MEAICLRIDGELNITNASELVERLAGSLNRSGDIVADFSEVQSCDTAALQIICSWRKSALEQGRRARIAAFSHAVEETAAVLGVSIQELSGRSGGDSSGV